MWQSISKWTLSADLTAAIEPAHAAAQPFAALTAATQSAHNDHG